MRPPSAGGVGTKLMLGLDCTRTKARTRSAMGESDCGSRISCLIGLLLVALGFASEKESQATAATAAAGVVSLVGVLVPVQGIAFPGLFPSTAPDDQPHLDRRIAQAGTALLCGIYLLFALSARLMKKRGG